MARTLIDLANRIGNLEQDIKDESNRVIVNFTNAFVQHLAESTPVDTSNAISNWQVSLDAPTYDEILPHVEGLGGSTWIDSAKITISESIRIMRGRKFGQPVFVYNNADYILELDAGSSRQEPAGFVDRSMVKALREFDSFNLNR